MPKRAARLRDAIEWYKKDMAEDGFAVYTIRSRMVALNGLTRVVGNPYLSQLGPTDTRDYFRTVKHLSGQGHNLYRSHIRRFYVWAREEGYLSLSADELMEKVKERKEIKNEKVWLTEDQAERLIESMRHDRDRAFAVMALDTGARAGEMCRFKLSDVRFDKGVILKTITKSKKIEERVDEMALTPQGEIELRRWLAIYARTLRLPLAEFMSREDYYLFPSHIPVALTRDFAGPRQWVLRPDRPIAAPYRIIGDAVRALGITLPPKARLGVHVTRRTAGRLANDASGDIRVAQALLGHEDQKTTEIYLGHSQDQKNRDDFLRAGGWRTPKQPGGGTVIPLRREG